MDNRSVRCRIVAMAWPATVETLLVGLIDLVDMGMISALSLADVAAVGAASQPKRILLMFILALNVGATALVSRRIGEEKHQEANRCMHQFLLVSALLAAVLYTVGYCFSKPILRTCGANQEFIGPAAVYFRILVLGQFFQALSLTINACQRAAGRTGISMVTNVTANLVNLVFNYLLIFGKFGFPRLEVMGAAIATSLGSLCAFFISVWSVRKNAPGVLHLHLSPSFWHWDGTLFETIYPVIFNAFQEQFFYRFGIFIFTWVAASLGTVEFALYQITMTLANLQGYAYDGYAITATALTGQSLGAKDPELAERYTRCSVNLAHLTAAVICAAFLIFRLPICSCFTDDPNVARQGANLLVIVALSCVPCSGGVTYAGALRGAGDTKAVARLTLWIVAFIRPLSAWILCYPANLGQVGVWIGFFLAYFLQWRFLRRRYRTGIWKTIRL